MSTIYDIHRWDSVIFDSSYPNPMVYIHPDQDLHKFVAANDNNLLISIEGADCRYNDRYIKARLLPSSVVPNERPNYFEKTGLYVLVLSDEWRGYPSTLGSCAIFGLTGGIPSSDNDLTTSGRKAQHHAIRPAEHYSRGDMTPLTASEIDSRYPLDSYMTNCAVGMDSSQLAMIHIGIIIVLITVLFVMKSK